MQSLTSHIDFSSHFNPAKKDELLKRKLLNCPFERGNIDDLTSTHNQYVLQMR